MSLMRNSLVLSYAWTQEESGRRGSDKNPKSSTEIQRANCQPFGSKKKILIFEVSENNNVFSSFLPP